MSCCLWHSWWRYPDWKIMLASLDHLRSGSLLIHSSFSFFAANFGSSPAVPPRFGLWTYLVGSVHTEWHWPHEQLKSGYVEKNEGWIFCLVCLFLIICEVWFMLYSKNYGKISSLGLWWLGWASFMKITLKTVKVKRKAVIEVNASFVFVSY